MKEASGKTKVGLVIVEIFEERATFFFFAVGVDI